MVRARNEIAPNIEIKDKVPNAKVRPGKLKEAKDEKKAAQKQLEKPTFGGGPG